MTAKQQEEYQKQKRDGGTCGNLKGATDVVFKPSGKRVLVKAGAEVVGRYATGAEAAKALKDAGVDTGRIKCHGGALAKGKAEKEDKNPAE